jgi:uncharacterized protein with GYD domain
MPTYLVLGNFTDDGLRNVKDTVKRTDAYGAMAKKCGVTVKETFWLMGQYDMMALIEAPDDATVTSLQLSAGSLGKFRAHTTRAFTTSEIESILQKMAN